MAGILTEDYGPEGRYVSSEGMSNQSGDSLAEWRSSEQVENGVPSTSPPFWDTDDEDDCGPKPSELFGRFTWKIDNYSQINKRELRSNVFEVGGYKWYILIYPQGCDVCNHLSLFLCVANHDKLLPGWSHFAQFTIAVVNKEPKKSKYSDTLHRFWKKEHDWGWKKFMELTKVSDGFVVNDTLVIKAQVQVIREKANRPFRCLDCQYRRELVRVYLSNVEQICRRFVEERRSKMCKLIEDRSRWSSFCDFWLGIDHSSRRRMSRDKSEAILKIVVKHFFIEKEVTSTLVMDSLYSGLKALECQSLNKKGKAKAVELEEFPKPMVLVEKDMFVLADDVLTLLERMASEPVPHQPLPPKDDKGLQNRTKDTSSGDDFNKDTIEREEKRLTELGRRTVEVYVLTHIFSSRIEVAYQEAIALKRQEELIREEEAAAGQAENELKAKRGASEKEKRAKKKQAKQKRSSRKGKDKGRDEKLDGLIQDAHILENESSVRILEDLPPKQAETILENDRLEGVSDVSDVGEDVPPVLQPDLDERDGNITNWDTDTSEIQSSMDASSCVGHNGRIEKRSLVVMDDSSSTCSSDSVPSVVIDGTNRANPLPNKRSQTSPNKGKSQQGKDVHENATSTGGGNKLPSNPSNDSGHSRDTHGNSHHPELDSVLSSKDQICQLEKETVVTFHKRLDPKDQVDVDRLSDLRSADASSSSGPGRKPSVQQQKLVSENTISTVEPILGGESSSTTPLATEKSAMSATRAPQSFPIPKSESLKLPTPSKSSTVNQITAVSRPGSVPPNPPGPRPSALGFSAIQTTPMLSRSVSAAGRLGTDQSPAASSYYPQSYRNAIIGRTSISGSPSGLPLPTVSSSGQAGATSQASSAFNSSVSTALQSFITKEQATGRPGIALRSGKPEALPIQPPRRDDSSSQEASRGSRGAFYNSSGICELQKKQYTGASVPPVSSSRHAHGLLQDDFPHLDIINDLLDDEQSIGRAGNDRGPQHQQQQHHLHPHHQPFSRQYSFPGNVSSMEMGLPDRASLFDHLEDYYDDSYSRFYGSVGGSLNELSDASLQQQVDMYSNAHIDGLIQNQWPYNRGPDFSRLNMESTDTDGYLYQLQQYMNSGRGMNGYPPYRPPNGR